MKGYQITFFTQQSRHHKGQLVSEWILNQAKELGLRGGTSIIGSEGIGHKGKIHSSHFFELSDQPVEVSMIVTEEEAEKLFNKVKEEGVSIFYAQSPVEFGFLGES
ncbi:DUF190 domain-containing protein [Marinomonas spartinae]|uniref:DUF190 domain-containing protein n=1 Tax=Marinomonas spartinae TaxID=1792290 RepID=UPI0018F1460C|nr:DUF190 domain-containing protein [Marinomonas spartinae]MBJ7554823.1 DUF190 domain-containing protein [Marinomonas spartinae]